MTTPQILLLAAVGVSVVVGFIMKMPSADRRSARKLLAATPWLDDESADGAQVKITGTVKVRQHGERFVSPLSDTRCVVQRVRVLVRRGQDPRGKLVEELKLMPFIVEGDGERFLVEADHVLLDISPVALSKSDQPRKNQLLTSLGQETASSTKSEFEETIVELGKTVTVAGTLAKQAPSVETDPKLRIVGTKESPIAIKLERPTVNLDDAP
ncbi:MAG: hypothetical protein ABI678_14275 [Kofleriaceae bacterium]